MKITMTDKEREDINDLRERWRREVQARREAEYTIPPILEELQKTGLVRHRERWNKKFAEFKKLEENFFRGLNNDNNILHTQFYNFIDTMQRSDHENMLRIRDDTSGNRYDSSDLKKTPYMHDPVFQKLDRPLPRDDSRTQHNYRGIFYRIIERTMTEAEYDLIKSLSKEELYEKLSETFGWPFTPDDAEPRIYRYEEKWHRWPHPDEEIIEDDSQDEKPNHS